MTAVRRSIESHQEDIRQSSKSAILLAARLASLAAMARSMALEMGYGFLLDPVRKLLSIGYRVTEGTLDPSCYDLLASEARLASFIAIAKVTSRRGIGSISGVPSHRSPPAPRSFRGRDRCSNT